MVKQLDCGIVISEFERKSRYYVRFLDKTLVKGMTQHIFPAIS